MLLYACPIPVFILEPRIEGQLCGRHPVSPSCNNLPVSRNSANRVVLLDWAVCVTRKNSHTRVKSDDCVAKLDCKHFSNKRVKIATCKKLTTRLSNGRSSCQKFPRFTEASCRHDPHDQENSEHRADWAEINGWKMRVV